VAINKARLRWFRHAAVLRWLERRMKLAIDATIQYSALTEGMSDDALMASVE